MDNRYKVMVQKCVFLIRTHLENDFFPHPPLHKLTNKNKVSIIDVALEDRTVPFSGPFG